MYIQGGVIDRALKKMLINGIAVLPHISQRFEASTRPYVFFYKESCLFVSPVIRMRQSVEPLTKLW
jgi:hypothetical protein